MRDTCHWAYNCTKESNPLSGILFLLEALHISKVGMKSKFPLERDQTSWMQPSPSSLDV